MSRRIAFVAAMLAFALVMAVTLPLYADQLRGKIASVNPDKNQIVVTENFKNWTFQVGSDAQVFLNDRQCKLSELQAGDESIITFTRQGERFTASVVRCMRK